MKLFLFFLLLGIIVPFISAQENRFFVVTINHTDNEFYITKVDVLTIDIPPPSYPDGPYKILVKDGNKNTIHTQSFTPPASGYITHEITESGEYRGKFVETVSIFLDFYLPYDAKAKDIVIVDDKGNTRAAIDVTPLSALTAEEKETIKQEKQQTAQSARLQEMMVPFGLLMLILLAGMYWWRRQR